MALYRTVKTSFWTDAKVVDDFTPEDRYFYLYLFTNPHTNLCGCYEISKSQMSIELGYTKDVIDRLLNRFMEIHNVIRYDKDTKEILLLNWHKYNWTESEKVKVALTKEIEDVKSTDFKGFLMGILNKSDTLSIPYPYPMDTSNTNTNTNTVTDTDNKSKKAQEILDLYHKTCPSLPKVLKLTDKRIKLVNARLKDYSIEQITEVFKKAESSEFLRNGTDTWKGADFEWILNTNNFVKIMEGNYTNKPKSEHKKENTFYDTEYDFDEFDRIYGLK